MKRLILIILSVFCLTACTGSSNEAVVGEWIMRKKNFSTQMSFYYDFKEDSSFTYSVCFYNSYVSGASCDSGEAEWEGTYKVKDNIIYLTVKKENQIKPNTIAGVPAKISDPPEKLIVDLNTMKLCDRDEGIDCENPFEKN